MSAESRNRQSGQAEDGASRARTLAVLAATSVLAFTLACLGESDESVATAEADPAGKPTRLAVEVVTRLPHDPEAFTQGLLWYRGKLYESTGQYGRSTLRRVDPASGEVEQRIELSPHLFGEGLARVGERLIQLTWREGVALVWSWPALEETGRFQYQGEGWGLCHDGRRLVMSDGSSSLTFRDARSFEVLRRLPVMYEDRPLEGLNELECAEGWVYANVYPTEWIVRIDPGSGKVVAVIDGGDLLGAEDATGVDVLNGIAFDPESGLFYLTGKYWPALFAVRFVAAASGRSL